MHRQRLQWLQRVTGQRTARTIGPAVRRSHTTVSRWLHNGIPAEEVIRICIRTDTDLVDALVALGMVPIEQRERIARMPDLNAYATSELAFEVARRIKVQESSRPES